MDRKDVELAIERFQNGDRPYSYRRPVWHLVTKSGDYLPAKYIYAMARGLESLETHTDEAKKDLMTLGFKLVELDGRPLNSIRYWWVNHKQTYYAELEGGYIWSPTKNQNGARNQTYINLTLVRPGDVIISYAGAQIRAIGVATSSYKDQVKPDAFGQTGQNWSNAGWLVPVEWSLLSQAVLPKDHIAEIVSLLPQKNSPLQANGNGNQGCYLASISPELGSLVLQLAQAADDAIAEQLQEFADQLKADEAEREIKLSQDVPPTDREQLVRSRIGQGAFRLHVLELEKACRLTGVSDRRFLIASHIKPWKDCSNAERLDGNNGLMLAPHVDKLFDRGWISFQDNGQLLISDAAESVVSAWGLSSEANVGEFTPKQRQYLEYHRLEVFRSR